MSLMSSTLPVLAAHNVEFLSDDELTYLKYIDNITSLSDTEQAEQYILTHLAVEASE